MSNIGKQEKYAADLEAGNYKTKLHYAIEIADLNYLSYLSRCLYTNADNTQEYLTTKFILALANYKDLKRLSNSASNWSILIYKNRDYIKPLND